MRMHTLNSATDLDEFFKPLHFLNRQSVYRKEPQSQSQPQRGVINPLVDISENKHAFFIHAELPGVKQYDVKITVDKNTLTISGKKSSVFSKEKQDSGSEKNPEAEDFPILKSQRVERKFGTFSRSFTLPDSVDVQQVEASFNDGVLVLQIPKKEEEIQKSFEVKIS